MREMVPKSGQTYPGAGLDYDTCPKMLGRGCSLPGGYGTVPVEFGCNRMEG
jgi:hypothetical protein